MRETVYEHIDGNNTFTVTAAERWSIGMIRKLAEQYPNDVEVVCENSDGSLLAHVPSTWMRIRPKRHRDISDEQRKALADRLRAGREANQQ